jgi:hypothetical protein
MLPKVDVEDRAQNVPQALHRPCSARSSLMLLRVVPFLILSELDASEIVCQLKAQGQWDARVASGRREPMD